MCDLLCFSRNNARELFKKKKKMPESWFERGKEGGSTTLEKVRARDVGLRTLGLFLYNFNLIPK